MPLDLFVGRVYESQRYQKFLTREHPWVMILRGLGGTGKSTLLAELERQTPRDTCVVTLDFAQESLRRDYLTLLENFSRQLEPYCDAERIVEFRRSVAQGRYEIGKKVAGSQTKIDELHQDISGDNLNISDTEMTIEVGDNRIEETRVQMREISKEKFYAQMKTFSSKQLVIMLDTCEWLNEANAVKAARWAVDELFPDLHASMQKKGQQCFLLMASRIPLQLNTIKDKDKEELKLGMLAREEVYQCLEQMEIHDSSIKDYIYNMTYGHAHSISIIHDIWEEHWELSDKPLSIADLPILQTQFYECALQDIIDEDVLQHFLNPPLNELTRYGVLLRRFNLPLLQAVFQEWLPEPEARKRFEQLIRYPHVEHMEDFSYTIHKLLREILSGYIQAQEPDKWRHYHELALNFLMSKADASQTSRRSPDWYYHQLAYDEIQGQIYWNEIKSRESQEYIDSLKEVARDKTLKLTLATLQCMDLHRDTTMNIA